MSLRVDKFCWFVRLAKTRSLATEMISKGKIKLNHVQVKPSKEVKVNDFIQFTKNNAVFTYKVLALLERRVGAKLVADYLLDCTDPLELEKFKTYQLAQQVYREYGTGKPSRKDRENMDSFFQWLEEEDDFAEE
ncbi:MAG TPA: RNA-binding S4 domain-containing protein [Fluviicola sp.]|nr:RNA-binding S4 domain-containing protein [Fluviicola sp.]